jgi:hypothetical protein
MQAVTVSYATWSAPLFQDAELFPTLACKSVVYSSSPLSIGYEQQLAMARRQFKPRELRRLWLEDSALIEGSQARRESGPSTRNSILNSKIRSLSQERHAKCSTV